MRKLSLYQAFIVLIALFSLPPSGRSQDQIKEITETFENGKPKLITIYLKSGTSREKEKEIHFDEDGSKTSETIFNGSDQTEIFWYKNGQKMLESHYRGAIPYGIRTEWHFNGSIFSQIPYENGIVKDGVVFKYNDAGHPIEQVTYKNGELNGPATYYGDDGQIKASGNYRQGHEAGLWKYQDQQGHISHQYHGISVEQVIIPWSLTLFFLVFIYVLLSRLLNHWAAYKILFVMNILMTILFFLRIDMKEALENCLRAFFMSSFIALTALSVFYLFIYRRPLPNRIFCIIILIYCLIFDFLIFLSFSMPFAPMIG